MLPVTTQDQLARTRTEEARRFGSRAYARQLLEARGQVSSSGRIQRVQAPLREEARVEQAPAVGGRRRLLPYELFLSTASTSLPLFPAGPFDELRCYQRRVVTRHAVEYLTWLQPNDSGSEGFRSFGCFRFSDAEPLPDLRRSRAFWRRLREGWAIRVLPPARVRGRRQAADGLPRQGLIRLEPAVASGVYSRDDQPDLHRDTILGVLRQEPSALERICWLESAFRKPAPAGIALHRYYLDADARGWLVRQEGEERRIMRLSGSNQAAPGLWIYPER